MSETVTVDLPENLTIAMAEELHRQLEGYTVGTQNVELNASAVVRADTAGFQVLCALAKSLEGHGVQMSWNSVPESVQLAARQLGLTQQLHIPQ